MKVITDLHIHSRYARACSKEITIPSLEKHARQKGITLLGTGDFQHPKWLPELKENLIEDETGILKTKTGYPFILQTEISLVYTHKGKGRRVHHLLLAPNFEIATQIQEALSKRGRIDYDGRPMLNITSPLFVEMLKSISDQIEIIPAHAWTPWFSIFGSKSGYDTLQQCFEDQTKHIHAIETGLSSDPEMNWRLSQLDKISLVSFSDSHSSVPWRIGREATIFETKKLTYDEIINSIRTGEGISETIEFYPEEGKYHYDGHRTCNVVKHPSHEDNDACPVCKKQLTLGVLHRVEQLADRPHGYKPKNAKPYTKLIPLAELIAFANGTTVATQKVYKKYYELLKNFDNELQILLEAPPEKLAAVAETQLVQLIIKARNQQIKFKPGYDGVYGEIEQDQLSEQGT